MRSANHDFTMKIPQHISQVSIHLAAESAAANIQLPSRASTLAVSPQLHHGFSRDLEKSVGHCHVDKDEVELMGTSTATNDHSLRKLLHLLNFHISGQMNDLIRELTRERKIQQRQSVTSIWSSGDSTLEMKDGCMEDGDIRKSQYIEIDSTSQGRVGNQTLICDSCSQSSMQSQQHNGQRKLLLIRLCKALVQYGAASHRIEESLQMTADYLDLPMTVVFFPGLAILCFSDMKSHTIDTLLVKCSEGFDMGKLAKVHNVANSIQHSGIGVKMALNQLHDIKWSPPTWGPWSLLLAYAISSLVAAPVMFHGSWTDTFVSGALGLLVGLVVTVAGRYASFSNLMAVSVCTAIGFIVRALSSYICFTGVVLSSIVIMLPGYDLTISIMELSARHMITGTIRFGYSMLYALFIGFGLEIGSSLYTALDPGRPSDLGSCNDPVSPWFYIPLYPVVAITVGMTFGASVRQWPAIVLCSCLGMTVTYFAGTAISQSQLVATIGAFSIGMFGKLYSRITGDLALVPLCAGMSLLTSGNIGVQGAFLLVQEGNDGGSFAMQMVTCSLGIAVGLFAASLIPVFPKAKGRPVNFSY